MAVLSAYLLSELSLSSHQIWTLTRVMGNFLPYKNNQPSDFCWATSSAWCLDGEEQAQTCWLSPSCDVCLGCWRLMLDARLLLSPWRLQGDQGSLHSLLATAAGQLHVSEIWVWRQPGDGRATAVKHECLPWWAHAQTQMISCLSSRHQNHWNTREDLWENLSKAEKLNKGTTTIKV